jgi:hypothetical protein
MQAHMCSVIQTMVSIPHGLAEESPLCLCHHLALLLGGTGGGDGVVVVMCDGGGGGGGGT